MQEPNTAGARVTQDMITVAIVSSDFHVLPGTQITVCTITLRNGAKVMGYNYGAIDPSLQDWQQGRQAAYDMAREKVWELEGYALRERMAAAPMVAVDAQSGAVSAVPEAEVKLLAIVRAFVEKHRISCAETIHQTDYVIEDAYGLIEDLCEVVGYYSYPEDES